jgi:hypothetical protein
VIPLSSPSSTPSPAACSKADKVGLAAVSALRRFLGLA